MTDLDQFRAETRAWLEANCPPEMREPIRSEKDSVWGGRDQSAMTPAQKQWMDAMGAKGWTVPDWPKEYGGGGLSAAETKILREEMARIRARNPLSSFGISMLGPALLKYGTEEQKKEHLPKIARGEIRWCQGYSEPNAGSDLASLATSAEDKGDHFLINGQKIWTSYANYADWIFCLVRTDKTNKHKGISFVLFDMQTPGVSTKPILLISGYSPFCETFFDNVKVPKENLVGELNKGWDVAKYLLGHEREMISNMGLGGGGRNPLIEGAIATIGLDHDGRLADPLLRAKIAEFEVRSKAFAAQSERFIDELKAGRAHPAQPSMMKYYGTELNKARHELLMASGGSDNLEWESERSRGGAPARDWLRTKANSIEGGTSEVQLNIISKRILELPGA
ncbi:MULTISPECIES: acyl-CoA dehydrogenase family protein [Sphingomonas]|jgi:acyl-CoA dehydrogenase|uniref:Acyl-CoA dehydrogenase n=1 Tax=Sphingomonas olei TaxID=1886787 RepID=A0ABY2QG64_9SPHN|nr:MULTISPECIES: acyl-CoA dehydrogenase family protein [Sphingomonas]KKI17412.1 acyl-CoA dehydrogenase [Sphingomonas sp. Ag1]MDF2603693.1 acyl-CoA dehydrogenase [Sphingomonas sp.]THG39584.1 acyl-CoA dehydrogenase [Sphingomonas olei]